MLSISFNPFPFLQTEKLVLRRILKSDVNEIFALRSDKELMKYIGRPLAKSPEESLKWMEMLDDHLNKNEAVTWAICLKENPLLIGTITLWRIDKENHRAEIGYMLQSNFHNKGMITEAVKRVVDYGFNDMHLHSVEADASPENAASIKVMEKMGFVKEAHFKENYFFNGEFLDTVVYSLLAQKS